MTLGCDIVAAFDRGELADKHSVMFVTDCAYHLSHMLQKLAAADFWQQRLQERNLDQYGIVLTTLVPAHNMPVGWVSVVLTHPLRRRCEVIIRKAVGKEVRGVCAEVLDVIYTRVPMDLKCASRELAGIERQFLRDARDTFHIPSVVIISTVK